MGQFKFHLLLHLAYCLIAASSHQVNPVIAIGPTVYGAMLIFHNVPIVSVWCIVSVYGAMLIFQRTDNVAISLGASLLRFWCGP